MKIIILLPLILILSDTVNEVLDENQTQNSPSCDLTLEGSICLFNKEKILEQKPLYPGLLQAYDFDDQYISDLSGNQNHSTSQIPRGPNQNGEGSSIHIQEGQFITIPSSDFEFDDYSISFWAFLIKGTTGDSQQANCPLIYKGDEDDFGPALFLQMKLRAFKYKVQHKVLNDRMPSESELISNARMNFNQWNNIVMTKNGNNISLYINGVLDAVMIIQHAMKPNQGNIYIGNVPWNKQKDCNYQLYIDNLYIYNRDLQSFEIQANSEHTLGWVEPGFVHLGCVNCSKETAIKSCISNYHLCTSLEIYSGAYHLAQTLGWTNQNNYLWSFDADILNPKKEDIPIQKGLGVCCKDM